MEKEMATHSSILAWKIPQTEEPGGHPSMGSQRAGPDLATKQQSHVNFTSIKKCYLGLGYFNVNSYNYFRKNKTIYIHQKQKKNKIIESTKKTPKPSQLLSSYGITRELSWSIT